jgi:hypothetical protein
MRTATVERPLDLCAFSCWLLQVVTIADHVGVGVHFNTLVPIGGQVCSRSSSSSQHLALSGSSCTRVNSW